MSFEERRDEDLLFLAARQGETDPSLWLRMTSENMSVLRHSSLDVEGAALNSNSRNFPLNQIRSGTALPTRTVSSTSTKARFSTSFKR